TRLACRAAAEGHARDRQRRRADRVRPGPRRNRRRRAQGAEWNAGQQHSVRPPDRCARRADGTRARNAARHSDPVDAERCLLRARRVAAARGGGVRRARAQVSDAPPVATRGLLKRYGEIVAVDGVDLTVERGDVFGYLGPNGAGKTTSLRMLLGLIRPTAGDARLFGRDPLVDGAKALQGVAGFVEGPRFYPYLSGRKNLELLAAYDGDGARSRIDEVLEVVELRDRAKDRVGGYSHGMRQRLG